MTSRSDSTIRQTSLLLIAEQTEQDLSEHKQQAKLIFRRIGPNSEPRCSIESGQYTLQYAPLGLSPYGMY